jgi:hypothetical protein
MHVATGSITVTGPAASSGAPVSRRCVRVKQDNSQRTQCPGGATDLMKLLKRLMGIPVAGSDEDKPYDGVFRVPIVSQDDGQGHSISITHGTVGEPQEGLTRHNETIFATPSDWAAAGVEVELELTGKLEFAPDKLTEARLIGTALDSAGNPLLSVMLRISGSKLITGAACHAQIAVSYLAYTTTRQVEVTPRGEEGDEENYYQSSLVVASECGGLERVKIDVPQCFEDFWAAWKDLLDEWNKLRDGGTLTVNEDEEEPEGSDLNIVWNFCGKHRLRSASLGVFDHLKANGDVCYPGVMCRDLTSPDCLPQGEEED